ncbi:alpha/beta hydrolase [Actinomycetes bacterium KLBMP 9759]
METTTEPVTGAAAGVPFLAVPPAHPTSTSPIVLTWHLMDPPRTERAFAAALPLAGLDAWRIHLGLPLCGSRSPEGGLDEVMRLGYEDAVLNLHRPVTDQAVAELGPALAELRPRLGLGDGPIGLVGASHGSAVAQLVLAEGDLPIAAAVLISPVVELGSVVTAMAARYGFEYPWSDASREVAGRIDFVARSAELARHGAGVLLLVGEDDDRAGFWEPARRLSAALGERAEARLVPGMAHALAEEPGVEPAPQIPAAAEVDRQAVEWFRRHLTPSA